MGVFFWKKRITCYLHSIQICPIKSMALNTGKTIIVEFTASKEEITSVHQCILGCFNTWIPNILCIIFLCNSIFMDGWSLISWRSSSYCARSNRCPEAFLSAPESRMPCGRCAMYLFLQQWLTKPLRYNFPTLKRKARKQNPARIG